MRSFSTQHIFYYIDPSQFSPSIVCLATSGYFNTVSSPLYGSLGINHFPEAEWIYIELSVEALVDIP